MNWPDDEYCAPTRLSGGFAAMRDCSDQVKIDGGLTFAAYEAQLAVVKARSCAQRASRSGRWEKA